MPRGVGHGVQVVEFIPAPVAEHETMRGNDPQQAAMFSDISPEERRAHAHPLRLIWDMVDASLSNGWRITSSTLRLNAARLPQH
jgi:hypothetical protein